MHKKNSRISDIACMEKRITHLKVTVAGIKKIFIFKGIPAPPKTSFRRSNPIFSTNRTSKTDSRFESVFFCAYYLLCINAVNLCTKK